MKKSTRDWLNGLLEGSNSKALEIRDYIVYLESLVVAVKSSEFDGFSFGDVNGENWFDAQTKIINLQVKDHEQRKNHSGN